MEAQVTYMTVKVPGQSWDQTPQTYLGVIVWAEALKIAKKQANEVRLCHSSGYSNQGHYIQPEAKHSTATPDLSNRWLNCPPSAPYTEDI